VLSPLKTLHSIVNSELVKSRFNVFGFAYGVFFSLLSVAANSLSASD